MRLKNISFCKLGEEECEVCLALTHQQCQNINHDETARSNNNESDRLMEDVATAAISESSYSKDGNAISAKERVEKIVPGVCSVCDDWLAHIQRANESRNAYRTDADTFHDPEDGIFYMSADMQKVIMLPRLPGVKTAVFTRRIIAYHETFAPLQPTKETIKQWKATDNNFKQFKPLGVVWSEAIQGRFDEDVASFVHKCLHDPLYRQAKHVII